MGDSCVLAATGSQDMAPLAVVVIVLLVLGFVALVVAARRNGRALGSIAGAVVIIAAVSIGSVGVPSSASAAAPGCEQIAETPPTCTPELLGVLEEDVFLSAEGERDFDGELSDIRLDLSSSEGDWLESVLDAGATFEVTFTTRIKGSSYGNERAIGSEQLEVDVYTEMVPFDITESWRPNETVVDGPNGSILAVGYTSISGFDFGPVEEALSAYPLTEGFEHLEFVHNVESTEIAVKLTVTLPAGCARELQAPVNVSIPIPS